MRNAWAVVIFVLALLSFRCSENTPTERIGNPGLEADREAVANILTANGISDGLVNVVATGLDSSTGEPRITQLTLDTGKLGGGVLTVLTADIGQLTELTFLRLDGNQLQTLPPQIGNLTKLVHLNVSNNNLTALPTEIGNLLALEILNVGGNQLESLPLSIGKLGSLDTLLSIESNRLTVLPDTLANLSSLSMLWFYGNQICDSLSPRIVQWLTGIPFYFGIDWSDPAWRDDPYTLQTCN
jgi:Leucine-rich repeat (LRR) protein